MRVQIDTIEKSKENIQLTTAGHNPSQLSSILNKDPSKRQTEQIHMKSKFEQRLGETGIATTDRLLVYYEYVLWMVQNCPEGTLISKEIIPLLERCTREFFNNKEFINNRKYVKLWLLLVAYSPSDDRNALFNHMKINSIGSKLDIFYSEFAKFQEMIRTNPQEAQNIYQMGIENGAQPIEELKKKYEAFKARNPNLINKQCNSTAPVQSVVPRGAKAAFPVFFDQNETANKEIGNTTVGVQFPLEAERKKENFPVPEKQWTSLPSSTVTANVASSKPAIFKDVRPIEQKASYRSDLFVRGCSVLSFEQWRLTDLLSKCPLSKMVRKSPIINTELKTGKSVEQDSGKSKSDNLPKQCKSNETDCDNPVSVSLKSTSISSPTINTKYALNNLIPLFNEKLVPSDEDSFCESQPNSKTVENFAVYRDNDTMQGNPFLTLQSKTPQTPAMPTIEETEKSTLKADSKASRVNLHANEDESAVADFNLNINENQNGFKQQSDTNHLLNTEIIPSLPQSTPVVPKRSIEKIYSPSPITPADKEDQSLSFSTSPTFDSPSVEQVFDKIYCFKDSYQKDKLRDLSFKSSNSYPNNALTFDSLVGSKLILADSNSYEIVECIGEGGFAKIFRCSISLPNIPSDRENRTNHTELNSKNIVIRDSLQYSEIALKIQVPPSDWEYYILQKIHTKLIYCRDLFVKPLNYFSYSNCSVLLMELGTCGNLLDCVNSYLKSNESINEFVVMYMIIELLKAINELHSIGIIHGDVKCENILVSEDSDLPPIKIVDFSRSVDISLDDLQKQRYFCTSNDNSTQSDDDDDDECFQQIYKDKPFTFEVDYFGIASIAHVLLFQEFIEITKLKDKLVIKQKPKRYWNIEFWTFFFDFFLNAKCHSGIPLVKQIEQIIEKMQKLLSKCTNFQLVYNKHTWNLLAHKREVSL